MSDEQGIGISTEGTPPGRRRRRSRRRRGSGRRPLPPVSIVPTIITLGNLVAGFAAISYAIKPVEQIGPWGWSTLTVSGMLIFIGMFLDAIDGSVARLTNSMSAIGAQLDSLSDLVTFGIAPAIMMLRLVSEYLKPGDAGEVFLGPEMDLVAARAIWGVGAIYVCCAALRLARFNVETPSAAKEHHMLFRGLPSPGAAGALASLIIAHQHWLRNFALDNEVEPPMIERLAAFGVPFIALYCALAMVSSVPYVHVMNRYVSGRRSFAYVARIVIPLFFALIAFRHETLAIAFTIYVLWSPIRWLIRGRRA